MLAGGDHVYYIRKTLIQRKGNKFHCVFIGHMIVNCISSQGKVLESSKYYLSPET